MPVSPKRALELALELENASSYPHFDRVAVRTPRRTFATFALRGADINFAFDLSQQAHFCGLAPHAIAPVEGGWGRMGWTSCDLTKIDAATFKLALLAAHARSNEPRRPRQVKGATTAKAAPLSATPAKKSSKGRRPPAAPAGRVRTTQASTKKGRSRA